MGLTSRFKAFFAGEKRGLSTQKHVQKYKVQRIAEEWASKAGIRPVDLVYRNPSGIFTGSDIVKIEIAALGVGFPHRKSLADTLAHNGYNARHEGTVLVVSEK